MQSGWFLSYCWSLCQPLSRRSGKSLFAAWRPGSLDLYCSRMQSLRRASQQRVPHRGVCSRLCCQLTMSDVTDERCCGVLQECPQERPRRNRLGAPLRATWQLLWTFHGLPSASTGGAAITCLSANSTNSHRRNGLLRDQ